MYGRVCKYYTSQSTCGRIPRHRERQYHMIKMLFPTDAHGRRWICSHLAWPVPRPKSGIQLHFLKVWCQLPLFLFILSFTVTYSQNYICTTHSSISIHQGLSPFSSLLSLSGKNLPGVQGFELWPAVQQASELPTELSCTLWAMLQPELHFWGDTW